MNSTMNSISKELQEAYTQLETIEILHADDALVGIPRIFFTRWKAVIKEAMKLAEDKAAKTDS